MIIPSETSEEKTIHVLISGDSLSLPRPWNVKLLEDKPEQAFQFKHTYPARMRDILKANMPGSDVIVSNMARRGATVKTLEAVSDDILIRMSPDVAIVHHGIVDCWIRESETLRRKTPEADFEAAFRAFFELKQQLRSTVPIVVIGILKTNARMLEKFPRQNEFIAAYNDILKLQASAHGAVYFLPDEGDDAALVHEDGHHLSRTGHQRYAEGLARIILDTAGERALSAHAIPAVAEGAPNLERPADLGVG